MAPSQTSGIRRTPLLPLGALHYQHFASRYPDFLNEVAQIRQRFDADLRRLARSDRRSQRQLIRKLLHDRSHFLPYLVPALNRTGRLRVATPDSIRAMAARINVFAPCHEPTRTKHISHGARQRMVQSFGPIKRTQQRLVADVIRATHPPGEQQLLFGGGIAEANPPRALSR